MSWTEAENFCRNKSGHLASVTSNTTNDYIVKGRDSRAISHLWIGGSDLEVEGSWKWADCNSWEFTMWASGEPNNRWEAQNCLNYHPAKDHFWYDQLCARPAPFLCSQTICSDTEEEDTWSSATLAAIAGSLASLLVLLLVVLLCIVKRRRNRRNAADVTSSDENPVYGTYFDPNPIAEVEDTNAYYSSDYEIASGRSRATDNNSNYET